LSQYANIGNSNRNPGSPSLPLGGIQSLFEEADADVLLLYDCCNSAATTASSSDQAHKGVTEVIAACGYETIAPEVGEHSFTHALAEVLSAASKGQPFSVAELHTRVLNRLKCWAPSFIKDPEGKRKEDPAGRLLFERQPRRTPIYSILCEPQPRRSILLSPLKVGSTEPETPTGGLNRGCVPSASISSEPSPSEKLSNIEEGARKRKRTLDEIEYPQVLLAIRLDRHELDLNPWKECLLRQLPPEAKEIKIEGIFGSFSTLLLLRIPVSVWDLLPDNSAYSFVGFVTTNNMIGIQPQPVDSEDVDETKVSQDSQASSSSIVWDLPVKSQSRETTPTSVRKSRETTPALAFILNQAAPRDIISPPLSVRALSDSSGSPPRSLSPDSTDVETAAYFETPDANIDESSGEPPSKVSVSFDFVIEEIPQIKFGEPENQDAILPINEGDEEEPNPPQPTKFKFSIWFGSKILHCAEDNTEEWLKHMRREARRKRRSSGRIRASGDDNQDKKSEKPGSSNSVQKRTLSESIGSDTDDEDLQPVTFLGANEVGSSARRLRRKVGERSSLIFDDPPRIAEAEEPESCEEVVEVTREEEEKEKDGQSLDRELPYFMQDMEADPEED
jgi:hypothetical protein